MKARELLHVILLDIKNTLLSEPERLGCSGLCSNIRRRAIAVTGIDRSWIFYECPRLLDVTASCCSAEVVKLSSELMQRWPEYSGVAAFPVPACGYLGGETEVYFAASESNDWMWLSEYGQARVRLLDWMIEQTA